MPVLCLRCRRPLPEREDDGVSLTLDGAPMLEALREIDRDALDEEPRRVLEALEAGLCPTCGRAR